MRRELLRELARLVRHAEGDGKNIGAYVVEHACELAHVLRASTRELVEVSIERDGAVAARLRPRLELALEREHRLQRARQVERARLAAVSVALTARSFELGIVLDVDIVLGDLLADRATKYVTFAAIDARVVVPVAMMRRARYLRRLYVDLACFVSERGLALRWKAGRGRLNFYAVEQPAGHEHETILVHLPQHVAPSVPADATSA